MEEVKTEVPAEKLLAKSKISSKGQITLPVEVRNRLGVKEGESVKFVADKDGRTLVLPVREEENPFERWIGAALPITEFGYEDSIAWVRDMRDDGYRQADIDEWAEMKKREKQRAA